MVVLAMVIALYVGIVCKLACQQCLDSCVCITGNTAEKLDPRILQGHLSAAANAAADENVCIENLQNASQCAMPLTAGTYYLRGDDPAILNLIHLEFAGMAKMLEDLAVIVSNCDFHMDTPFYWILVSEM